MNGSGGWPLNVFAGHDGKPFLAATYVPRENWMNMVVQIGQAWKENREEIVNFANQLSGSLQEEHERASGGANDLKKQLFAFLEEHYDSTHPDFSGAGRAPRFPSHSLYCFLLSQGKVPETIASKLESTLEAIQDSGLHDRVGGGFHRYSTDREWRVPHFEKMLYDNAQLMAVFALASSRFVRPDFLQTAEHVASYLLRDMVVHKDGQFLGFASAEDADDPGGEGSFYAWTPQQLEAVLGENTGRRLSREWDITSDTSNIHGVYRFRIPHPRGSKVFQALSPEQKIECRLEWATYYEKLQQERNRRPRPFLDDKVVTDTNALTLLGFTILYAHSPKNEYLKVIENLVRILTGRYANGNIERLPGKSGHITDYAHTALAMFTAWEVTGTAGYLDVAISMVKTAFKKFAASDGKIFTSAGESGIFMKFEEKYDHAQPAGAHSLLLTWTRLRASGFLKEFEPLVLKTFERRQTTASQIPAMVASFIQALDEYKHGPVTLTLPDRFIRGYPLIRKWTGTHVRLIRDNQSGAFVLCEQDRCLLPVKTPDELPLKFEWKE
ncbi:MAG TPA: DUF255 domain-containing protein, partial [Bacteroidales bacterium]